MFFFVWLVLLSCPPHPPTHTPEIGQSRRNSKCLKTFSNTSLASTTGALRLPTSPGSLRDTMLLRLLAGVQRTSIRFLTTGKKQGLRRLYQSLGLASLALLLAWCSLYIYLRFCSWFYLRIYRTCIYVITRSQFRPQCALFLIVVLVSDECVCVFFVCSGVGICLHAHCRTVQNSWGPGWGMSGYFNMVMDFTDQFGVNHSSCGIGTQAIVGQADVTRFWKK